MEMGIKQSVSELKKIMCEGYFKCTSGRGTQNWCVRVATWKGMTFATSGKESADPYWPYPCRCFKMYR